MVKDYRDYKRKPVGTTSWATLSDWQLGIFHMLHPTERKGSTYYGFGKNQFWSTGWNEK